MLVESEPEVDQLQPIAPRLIRLVPASAELGDTASPQPLPDETVAKYMGQMSKEKRAVQ